MIPGIAAAGAAGASGSLTALQLASSAAAPLFGAMAARREADIQQQHADLNAKIGETRAIQSDTTARAGMEADLGAARAVFGANGQTPNVGTLELLNDIRETRGRERRIQYGTLMQQADDYRTQAENYRRQGSLALPLGLSRASPSLFSLYELMR